MSHDIYIPAGIADQALEDRSWYQSSPSSKDGAAAEQERSARRRRSRSPSPSRRRSLQQMTAEEENAVLRRRWSRSPSPIRHGVGSRMRSPQRRRSSRSIVDIITESRARHSYSPHPSPVRPLARHRVQRSPSPSPVRGRPVLSIDTSSLQRRDWRRRPPSPHERREEEAHPRTFYHRSPSLTTQSSARVHRRRHERSRTRSRSPLSPAEAAIGDVSPEGPAIGSRYMSRSRSPAKAASIEEVPVATSPPDGQQSMHARSLEPTQVLDRNLRTRGLRARSASPSDDIRHAAATPPIVVTADALASSMSLATSMYHTASPNVSASGLGRSGDLGLGSAGASLGALQPAINASKVVLPGAIRGVTQFTIEELCEEIRSTPELSNAPIGDLYRREIPTGVQHEFILVRSVPQGRPSVWIRIDRAAKGYRERLRITSRYPADDTVRRVFEAC